MQAVYFLTIVSILTLSGCSQGDNARLPSARTSGNDRLAPIEAKSSGHAVVSSNSREHSLLGKRERISDFRGYALQAVEGQAAWIDTSQGADESIVLYDGKQLSRFPHGPPKSYLMMLNCNRQATGLVLGSPRSCNMVLTSDGAYWAAVTKEEASLFHAAAGKVSPIKIDEKITSEENSVMFLAGKLAFTVRNPNFYSATDLYLIDKGRKVKAPIPVRGATNHRVRAFSVSPDGAFWWQARFDSLTEVGAEGIYHYDSETGSTELIKRLKTSTWSALFKASNNKLLYVLTHGKKKELVYYDSTGHKVSLEDDFGDYACSLHEDKLVCRLRKTGYTDSIKFYDLKTGVSQVLKPSGRTDSQNRKTVEGAPYFSGDENRTEVVWREQEASGAIKIKYFNGSQTLVLIDDPEGRMLRTGDVPTVIAHGKLYWVQNDSASTTGRALYVAELKE